MGGVDLLDLAALAGLEVVADGGRLRVRGPKIAERLALQLIQHKAELLPVLAAREAASVVTKPVERFRGERESWKPPAAASKLTPGIPDGWTAESWRRRLLYLADICIHPDRALELRKMAEKTKESVD